jgi:hypothetical protein
MHSKALPHPSGENPQPLLTNTRLTSTIIQHPLRTDHGQPAAAALLAFGFAHLLQDR